MHDPFLNQSQDRGGPAMPSLKEGQWLFNRRYELVRKLGAGGMGVVWLARDHTEETQVALKFLPAVLVQHEGEMKRLKEEVRAGKELRHPGIVATYALELEDSTAAIVMEYVEGKTLAELLEAQKRGFFEPEEITGWVREIAAAVDYLHADAKRIHRDLKPANILVDAAGRARLMDFGISRRVQEGMTRHSQGSVVPSREGRDGSEIPAKAGTTMQDSSATLAYASPQQLAGLPAAPADDLYSLGALLYELLTGTPPFFRGDAALVAVQIATQTVTRLMARRAELVTEGANTSTGQTVPEPVETAVLACLAKEREKRPANAKTVCEALTPGRAAAPSAAASVPKAMNTSPAALGGPSALPQARRPLWRALGVLLLLAAAGWGWKTLFPPDNRYDKLPSTQKDLEEAARKKVAEEMAAKDAAAKQQAEELQKKLRDEEQKRLAAEAATAKAKADAETAKKAAMPPPAPPKPPTLTATKESPFTNSLGMKFVPVPIGAGPSKDQRILFSIWETRSRDYAAFVKDSGHDAGEDWKTYNHKDVPVGRGEGENAEESSHPVVNVNYDDAVAFCAWLTKKDRASGLIGPQDEYRLPSDVEWSYAVGIGDQEDASASPKDKDEKISNIYPWGQDFPPHGKVGNLSDSAAKAKFKTFSATEDYTDGYETTAPVGKFNENQFGLFDLGGNASELCADWHEEEKGTFVVRGSSWAYSQASYHLSSRRGLSMRDRRSYGCGFRCVLVVVGR
ncbi:MAG: SUMF1/EgtB/PvdO family nonheme iron enzyme [Verrucomicrobiaceae bacterium]|nr:SUMF1/EgtB/PvdO family nonheme iron enzyme [Verrucomicrobiaceae bacterium]